MLRLRSLVLIAVVTVVTLVLVVGCPSVPLGPLGGDETADAGSGTRGVPEADVVNDSECFPWDWLPCEDDDPCTVDVCVAADGALCTLSACGPKPWSCSNVPNENCNTQTPGSSSNISLEGDWVMGSGDCPDCIFTFDSEGFGLSVTNLEPFSENAMVRNDVFPTDRSTPWFDFWRDDGAFGRIDMKPSLGRLVLESETGTVKWFWSLTLVGTFDNGETGTLLIENTLEGVVSPDGQRITWTAGTRHAEDTGRDPVDDVHDSDDLEGFTLTRATDAGEGGDGISVSTPTTVARVLDTSTDIGIIASEDGGDKLAVFGDKDASGNITRIEGTTFVDVDGNSLTVWFGPDGLPERAVTGSGWVFAISNHVGSAVDLTVTEPNGTSTFHPRVVIDPGVAARLRTLAQEGLIGTQAKVRVSGKIEGEITTLSEGLEVASLGISFFGCAGDIATALTGIGAPVGIPSAILSCSSFLLSTFSLITGNEAAAEAASTLTTISCAIPTIGSVGSCIGVGLIIVQGAVDQADEVLRAGDRDGDGEPDVSDGCPKDPNKTSPGNCGCGIPDTLNCCHEVCEVDCVPDVRCFFDICVEFPGCVKRTQCWQECP